MLCSLNRARYDVIEFSNRDTGKRSETESSVQFENEMALYSILELNRTQLSMF